MKNLRIIQQSIQDNSSTFESPARPYVIDVRRLYVSNVIGRNVFVLCQVYATRYVKLKTTPSALQMLDRPAPKTRRS